jgi:tight adherence protein C
LLLGGGFVFMLATILSGLWMLRDMHREQRLAARVRVIHGQAPETRITGAEPQAIKDAMFKSIAAVGRTILRSGVLSARTLNELEGTLAASGLRGSQGVAIYVGAKLLLMCGLPLTLWLVTQDMALPGMVHTLAPPIGGVVGLLAPDWLVGRRRTNYLNKLEQGLPDALDMMVICTQAGLGLGPAIIRVSAELQHAYREIAMEFEQTANELQILADSRVAVTNLGQRTGLENLKRLATTLVQTIHYGTPLSEALRVLSAEMRQEVLTKCEERAARLPVLLTLPMIVFILPCVFLIAGGPAMIQVMRSFSH